MAQERRKAGQGGLKELVQEDRDPRKALVSALAEMHVQGVSTRKVKAITEELCGHAFSASAISDGGGRSPPSKGKMEAGGFGRSSGT
jgi:transposase-like protein